VSSALYRRYRPESFAEVIGQEHVTAPLSVALDKNRVNHAYLFSGPRGCGKTTSARILARCLNCEKGPTATPCGSCPSCLDLARGGSGSLDVVEIDAASHGGVDDARDLRERAAFAPVRDRYKVFIIDEAHMVSTQGFNALLKIVEEPPEHIRFIFATTEPEKVIGTIRSRTHHYPFRLVPPERLQAYLNELCQREQVPASSSVLPLVVRAGGGSVRDSLSVLDQLMAGAGDEGLTYQLAVSLLGYTDGALLDDVIDALAAGDGASVFAVVDRVVESGHDPRRFVEDLLERLRDLLVVAATREGAPAVLRSVPEDQLNRMQGQAQRFGAGELSRAADVVNAALTEMTGATSPRLQVELLCARLLLPAADDTERGLRARLDRLEKRIGMAVPATSGPAPAAAAVALPGAPAPPPTAPAAARSDRAPAPANAPAAAAAPTPAGPGSGPPPAAPAAPASSAGALDVDTIRRMWPEVLSTLAGMKRTTWSLVSHYAQVLGYDGARLVLGFDSAGRAQSFGKGAHQEFLRQALIEVIGLDCRFEAVSGEAAQPSPPVPPPTAASSAGPTVPPATAAPAPPATAAPAPPATAAPAPPARQAPAPQAQPRQAAPTASTVDPAVRTPTQVTPYDDIPPSDEPPPEDERPPEQHGWSRRPASGPADTAPAGLGQAAPRTNQATPGTSEAAPETSEAEPRTSEAEPTRPAGVPRLESARPARTARTRSAAAPPAVTVVSDDEASPDDPEIEGSGLVGAAVVEQMLGGRIIEERRE
jgi:DNA polymerase III subunit gamma/tau